MNCKKIYGKIVDDFSEYVKNYNLKSIVLGISGGIDSTLLSIICRDVSKRTGVKFIGRSLPIMNKLDEFRASILVGKAFCSDFKVVYLDWAMTGFMTSLLSEELGKDQYPEDRYYYSELIEKSRIQTNIANGNIQARLRMTYLYNLSSINGGIVIGTDNRTEWNLGFWTLHGDVGDFYPILDLWKTQVYELSRWLLDNKPFNEKEKEALEKSIGLIPTDGLGISNSDLDQLGAKSYDIIDSILKSYLENNQLEKESLKLKYGEDYSEEVWNNVINRHKASEFKRVAKPAKIDLTKWKVSEL